MYFSANRALLANYDCVFAVDTNTRELHDHRVSLTAAVEVLSTQACGQVLFEPRFFVEFLDVESKPEQLGWMIAAGIINRSPGYQAIKKIAFVVDCDETNIRAYNARTLAPHRTTLPERVTLVQATTDTGGEYLPNAVLKYADYIGTTVLRDIASGRIPMNMERVPPGLGYVAVRTMSVTRLPDSGHRSRAGLADFRLTVIEMCISNRHRDHKKGGNSEPVMNERMSSGRLRTFLVRRQSVASNSSRFFGLPFARVPLKWAHTSSSGLSSGA
jgi:hypothetical protein